MRTLLGLLLVAGCSSSLEAVRSSSELPGSVQVQVREVKNDLIVLDVTNSSSTPLVIDRDALVLKTPRDTLKREPGGASSAYTVPPGEHHQVNVRFLLGTILDGETVELVLDRAFTPTSRRAPGGAAAGVQEAVTRNCGGHRAAPRRDRTPALIASTRTAT